jgi:hypothetical protein
VEKVTGIGGVFFRARNPGALSRWYAEHLGVPEPPADDDAQPWSQEAGPTAWAAFPEDTDYFRDLDAMVAQLRASGITVEPDSADYPMGRFARLADPEDNQIELWEPKTH